MTNQWTAGTVLVAVLGFLYWIRELRRKSRAVSMRNKVVLITGASSGLGEACAHLFYKEGAKVILASRRESELKRVKQDLLKRKFNKDGQPTHEPRILVLDLEQFGSIPEKVVTAVGFYGSIDILVNNGGISYRGEVVSTKLEVDIKVMDINYFGQIALTKAVLPYMIKQKSGHIVAVSSVQGKLSIPFRSSYSASKHALEAFCDCLRAEVAEYDVRVSVISPGYIQTNLSKNAVLGNGARYGITDSTTSSGMTPRYVANKILNAIQNNIPELILSSLTHRCAAYLRNYFCELYFWYARRRARKQRQSKAKAE